ncbi:sigma-54 factor interaction domain-containing protein, partial [Vibrio parahaemolyticus]
IVQNCAAIPEQLLESELFGHKKGSFTGADKDKVGLFEAANGGTLFLDEIGDMPMLLQAKLLRVLQERKVRPIGTSKEIEVDVRVIAATHCNLMQQIKDGGFRADL